MDNTCLVKKVGNSHLGFMYFVENNPCLHTFEDFFHAPYCQAVRAQDDNNVDNSEKAKESSSNKAAVRTGNGSEFKSDEAGNESDVMVEVGDKPVPEVKGKCKASESVRAAKSRKDGTKRTKVATDKPTAEVEVKAKPVAKAAAAKTTAKGKTPPKFPSKKK